MLSVNATPMAVGCGVTIFAEPRSSRDKNTRPPYQSFSTKSGCKQDRRRTVVLYGEIPELALYRADVLERMGFGVLVPRSKPEAVATIKAGRFQAAILSYTLPSDTVVELADLLRQSCPGCPLLIISRNAEDDPHIQPDAVIRAELGPAGLESAVRGLFRSW